MAARAYQGQPPPAWGTPVADAGEHTRCRSLSVAPAEEPGPIGRPATRRLAEMRVGPGSASGRQGRRRCLTLSVTPAEEPGPIGRPATRRLAEMRVDPGSASGRPGRRRCLALSVTPAEEPGPIGWPAPHGLAEMRVDPGSTFGRPGRRFALCEGHAWGAGEGLQYFPSNVRD